MTMTMTMTNDHDPYEIMKMTMTMTMTVSMTSQKLGPAGAAVHTCVVVVQKPCDIAGIEPTGCYAHYRQLPASCMCK